MKAAVYRSYGPPEILKIEEVEKPTPGKDEVLVKILASSVNPADWYGMIGLLPIRLGSGLIKPKEIRLGTDFAGVVEAVGKDVTQFKPGDEVYGARNGAFAEYVCASKFVFHKPAQISFEQAGGVAIAAITALQGLRDHGQIQAGQKVLINGASGGVGSFAVQIAKAFGAEVTGVCSPRNVELVRALGADYVIDYTKEDFTCSGKRYDLILDNVGSRSFRECQRVLNPKANFVIVGGPKTPLIGPLSHVIMSKVTSVGASQKVAFFMATFKREDFMLLNEMFESGQVKPVVEQTYPLREISSAMRHLGTGHAKGKIIVAISS